MKWQRQSMWTRAVAILMIAILALGIFGCGAQTPTPSATPSPSAWPSAYNVGLILSLTGPGAWYGKVMGEGALLAIDEINASGELPFKITAVQGDCGAGDINLAISALQKMISINKISFLFPSWDQVVPAVMPLCQQYHIPAINGGGASNYFIGIPYLYDVRAVYGQFMPILTNFYIENLGLKRIAFIWGPDQAQQVGYEAILKVMAQHNMSFVDEERHSVQTETDFRPYLMKIKAANPDGILSMSWANDLGYIVKQARELGINVPIASFSGYTADAIAIAGGAAIKNTYQIDVNFDLNTSDPFGKNFVEHFRKTYGEDPTILSANFYEEVYVMKDAIKHVIQAGGNPFDGAQVYKAIADVGTFNATTVPGTLQLLPNGSCLRQLAIWYYYDDNLTSRVVFTGMPVAAEPVKTATPAASQ